MGPISVGFVAKNLNSPEFDAYQIAGRSTPKVKVEPQMRAGLALAPFSWLNLAADMDVSKNKTILAGVESQNIGGGVEFDFGNLNDIFSDFRKTPSKLRVVQIIADAILKFGDEHQDAHHKP